MDSLYDDRGMLCRVSTFGYLRIDGYLLLPAAFRSLSRLSSALSAKASTLRSCLRDYIEIASIRKLRSWFLFTNYFLISSACFHLISFISFGIFWFLSIPPDTSWYPTSCSSYKSLDISISVCYRMIVIILAWSLPVTAFFFRSSYDFHFSVWNFQGTIRSVSDDRLNIHMLGYSKSDQNLQIRCH